jgi:gas vesicle protein
MKMKTLLTGLAMLALLGAFLGPALAQRPASGPEDERMVRMMKMMEQMQDQMKQMHGQMAQMKQMHEQMTQMKQMHDQMSGMMQQHRAEMQKVCPGAAAPDPTKKGG